MKNEITSLHLQQFRSYDDFAVELSPNVNIIVGPNASGKTNLLEAVLLVAGSGSFRALVTDVISYDAQWARVEAAMSNINRRVAIERSGDSFKRH